MDYGTNKKSHEDRVAQATEMVISKKNPQATYRLGYHLMAPSGWINDPNGLIYFNEEYHVFYQHHPYDETWEPMHWGHAVSDDLVHWRHLSVALAPGDLFDQNGCFSGSAVDDHGVLTLIYTGHNVVNAETDDLYQNQNIARSTDGIHFEKANVNPVIKSQPHGMQRNFRDPKVWNEEGIWKMVVGSTEENRGQVLLYQSTNLENWDYQGILAKHNGGNEGYMWECPDFFLLGDKHVLLLSPQGIEPEGDRYQNQHQTGYFVGDYRNGVFERGAFTELDFGHDFYAVQTFLDGKGRRIAIGWMDMWESPMPSQKEGWADALTLPRELRLADDGKIRMIPVDELKALRMNKEKLGQKIVTGVEKVDLTGQKVELELAFDMDQTDASVFGVKVACAEDGSEETVLTFDQLEQTVTLDRDLSGEGVSGARIASIRLADTLNVCLFLDRSSIEVFINEGETVLTSRIYPKESSQSIFFFAEGGTANLLGDGYQLKTILE
nr:glycoside hydrolase family 32 protein [Shouchella patagoniensis]